MSLLQRLFDHEYKELKKFEHIADQIEAKDEEMQALSDKELHKKSQCIRQ